MVYGLPTIWTIMVANPSRKKRFSLFQNQPDWLWELPTLLFNGNRGSFPGIKWLGHEVDHSPKSRTEVKNGRSYTFIPPLCLHSVNITFKV